MTRTSRAHPRVCGENVRQDLGALGRVGSSPRVRGKHQRGRSLRHARGLIPACAGKTDRSSSSTGNRRAHPRVCGENDIALLDRDAVAGSSPRVRGKPRRRPRKRVPPGLIPACAGKTPAGPRKRPRRPAHPRVCGENAMSVSSKPAIPGSSPRVRGKRLDLVRRHRRARLIPACAGKTGSTPTRSSGTTAHPRVCGENEPHHLRHREVPGSSPRVRGKRAGRRGRLRRQGLIPACAGKTSPVCRPRR